MRNNVKKYVYLIVKDNGKVLYKAFGTEELAKKCLKEFQNSKAFPEAINWHIEKIKYEGE